jgi:hypothetical protein
MPVPEGCAVPRLQKVLVQGPRLQKPLVTGGVGLRNQSAGLDTAENRCLPSLSRSASGRTVAFNVPPACVSF